MSKNSGRIALIIAIIALCLSIVSIAMVQKPAEQEYQDTQYVLYLGTNDKDTNKPVFTQDEAKAKAENILVEYFSGYTIQDASGGWEDEGILYQEYTMVIYLSDTTLEKVQTAADELLQVFNQKSVMIQTNETKTGIYDGNRRCNNKCNYLL